MINILSVWLFSWGRVLVGRVVATFLQHVNTSYGIRFKRRKYAKLLKALFYGEVIKYIDSMRCLKLFMCDLTDIYVR